MKEEVLEKIKKEFEEEKAFQIAYNAQARMANKEIAGRKGVTNRRLYIDRRTKKDILVRLLRKHRDEIKLEDTNGIYVYMGTYREKNNFYEDGPEDIRVSYDDESAVYSVYKNIEHDREVLVSVDGRDYFESKVKIVTGNYEMLQKEFISMAVKNGQDYATKRIVKSYRRSSSCED
ncbi:MAG: hypothetical protein II119_03860 [Bacilli bacterium]|nr:hypothetical protein [Bacilli bacterium]MBQ6282336.1 hypothetical protein [Bacilli bacterium]